MNSADKKQKKTKKTENYLLYDFVKITGILPTLLYLRPKVIFAGEKKFKDYKGGMLLSCNHRGFTDPVMAHCIFWNRRLHCLATKDLYKKKSAAWFFDHTHCIQVDKQNFSMDSFHKVTECLKKDKIVLIFPEGQVNYTQEVLAFKSGATLMAFRANKPIVPVYFPEYGKWYNRRVALVGDPIDVRAICNGVPSMDKLGEVSDYIRQKELELKELYETTYKKKKS